MKTINGIRYVRRTPIKNKRQKETSGYCNNSRYTFAGGNIIAYKKHMKRWSKRKIFKIIWFSFAIIFFGWNWTTFQSRNLPDDTFESTKLVTVTQSDDFATFQSYAAKNGI